MSSSDTAGAAAPRVRARSGAKRTAILDAARRVFGRDGYARASIDEIAAEAGASTRTLYNHFGSKEALFTETVTASATEVADAQIEMVNRNLGAVVDLEAALVELGYEWVTSTVRDRFAEHFAIVRQIASEATHFPEVSLQAWQDAGPRRVHHELGARLEQLRAEGRLEVARPDRAARHFAVLIGTEVRERTLGGTTPLADAELREIVADGVRTFLYGYAPRDRAADAVTQR